MNDLHPRVVALAFQITSAIVKVILEERKAATCCCNEQLVHVVQANGASVLPQAVKDIRRLAASRPPQPQHAIGAPTHDKRGIVREATVKGLYHRLVPSCTEAAPCILRNGTFQCVDGEVTGGREQIISHCIKHCRRDDCRMHGLRGQDLIRFLQPLTRKGRTDIIPVHDNGFARQN